MPRSDHLRNTRVRAGPVSYICHAMPVCPLAVPRLLLVLGFEQPLKDRIILPVGDATDIDCQIDIERTHVPSVGQQQFRHPAADEYRVIPVKAEYVHYLDQNGLARLDRIDDFRHWANPWSTAVISSLPRTSVQSLTHILPGQLPRLAHEVV
jgi:hypothetical protein